MSAFEALILHVHRDCVSRKYAVGLREFEDRRSRCQWVYNDENSRGVIFVDSRASTETHPLDALWDLIHEWGHTMREPPPIGYHPGKNEETRERELFAWVTAWKAACAFSPGIWKEESAYLRRQEECLNSLR